MKPYRVELGPTAARTFERLDAATKRQLAQRLERLAVDAAGPGRIRGKAVKTIRGTHDSFHRLRVGDWRVMYDVIDGDGVILVLGIVHRSDLERWLRGR